MTAEKVGYEQIELLRAFIHREAALLDAREYRQWLDLFADDGRYWLPIDPQATHPAAQLNLIYDERDRLQDRVARLVGGKMHAEQPPSQIVRLVSGTALEAVAGDEFTLCSAFMLAINRLGTMRLLAGRLRHRLRCGTDGILIAEKRVDLIGANDALEDISFLP